MRDQCSRKAVESADEGYTYVIVDKRVMHTYLALEVGRECNEQRPEA
jgi:hypothetical protein